MKLQLLILVGLCTVVSSQNNELNDTWYLASVQLENEFFEKPENIESISDTYFSITENPTMITQTCEMSGGIIGYFELNEDFHEIVFSDFIFFEGDCSQPETLEFIDAFNSFFAPQIGATLNYAITTENENLKTLVINDPNGNFVKYYNHLRYPPQEISENNWFLTELNISGTSHTIQQNEEIPFIEAEFINDIFQSNFCENAFGGLADFNQEDSQVYLYGLTTTDSWCDQYDNELFRILYLEFYFSNATEPFSYLVTNNSDGSKSLQISGFDGDYSIYNNTMLETYNSDASQILTHPNPVTNKLTVENPDMKITSVTIRDVSGKMIKTKIVSSAKFEIDFSAFSTGIYFISFEQNGKILKTEKISKK